RSERYRTIIIHEEAIKGKTRTAHELAKVVLDATYIDLQQVLVERTEVAAQIDRFGPQELEEFLVNFTTQGQVLIVDHADLLLNTWTPAQKRAFARWVDDGLDGFTDSARVLIFFIQTDLSIVNYPMQRLNRLGRTRIFRLGDFDAL
ncbi:MAG: hypothetical protein ACYCZF_16980, partial [Anaerolineae bacterium]